MTHFMGVLINEGDAPDGSILDKFSENRKVPQYVYKTKSQWISDERKRLQDQLDDDHALRTDPSTDRGWIRPLNDRQIVEIRDKLLQDDEDFAERFMREDPRGITFADNGDWLSTYNTDSHWDWYSYGRYWYEDHEDIDGMPVEELAKIIGSLPPRQPEDAETDAYIPRNFIARDEHGEPQWLEDGPTGWFGAHIVEIEPDDWKQIVLDLLASHPGERAWGIDFHI
jgi:hypothetical protein